MQDDKRRSPLQIFAKIKVNVDIKHWHPYGCPVYALYSQLQNNKKYNKW